MLHDFSLLWKFHVINFCNLNLHCIVWNGGVYIDINQSKTWWGEQSESEKTCEEYKTSKGKIVCFVHKIYMNELCTYNQLYIPPWAVFNISYGYPECTHGSQTGSFRACKHPSKVNGQTSKYNEILMPVDLRKLPFVYDAVVKLGSARFLIFLIL